MKVIKEVKNLEEDTVTRTIIHRCPVCGAIMDETELNRDYCKNCENLLKTAENA